MLQIRHKHLNGYDTIHIFDHDKRVIVIKPPDIPTLIRMLKSVQKEYKIAELQPPKLPEAPKG